MTSLGEFEALVAGLSEASPTRGQQQPPGLRRVAVLGAGPVGQALSCQCLAAGCEVALYTAFESERDQLAATGAITVRGDHLAGSYRLAAAGSREPAIALKAGIDDALSEADALLVATPAVAHSTYAGLLAGRVDAEQLLALVPARRFGAVEVARALRRFGTRPLPTVVELAAPPYRVASPAPGALEIAVATPEVAAAAIPNRATDAAVARLRTILPMVIPARGVLDTTFSDLSGVLDAPPALLREPAAVVRKVDEERRRVAFAYGVRDLAPLPHSDDPPPPLPVGDPRVHDALCCSLVPLVSAGEVAGLPTRAAAALVDLGSALSGLDYLRHGRTLASLGLDRFEPEEIRRALDGRDGSLLEEALA